MSYDSWCQKSRDYRERIQLLAPHLLSQWKLLDKLDLASFPYVPTHPARVDGDYFAALQAAKGGMLGLPFLVDVGISGFLQKAEALKLYEMGRLCTGDILELGTHKGLSTSILARALNDRGTGRIVTVDVRFTLRAIGNLMFRPGFRRVQFVRSDGTKAMDRLIAEKRRFGFIFVDHWHGYNATREAAERTIELLSDGGYVMFHDFFDPSNKDPDHVYGVYQAAIDVLGDREDFQFAGSAGSAAVFKRV